MRNVGHIQVAAQDGVPIGIESSVKWRGYRLNSISENLNATTFQLIEWENMPMSQTPAMDPLQNPVQLQDFFNNFHGLKNITNINNINMFE